MHNASLRYHWRSLPLSAGVSSFCEALGFLEPLLFLKPQARVYHLHMKPQARVIPFERLPYISPLWDFPDRVHHFYLFSLLVTPKGSTAIFIL